MRSTVKNNIVVYLERKHMKQRELAKALNISEVTISRYLSGERAPSVCMAVAMASVLECCVEDLYPLRTARVVLQDKGRKKRKS